MSTIAGGRAARRQTLRRYSPTTLSRRPHPPLAVGPARPGSSGSGWSNTPSIADDNSKILNAGRITGLLAGILMALVVLQMAWVPALERRVGSDRVARWHAISGRYTICLVLAHLVLIMWGYALQARKSFGDIVQQTIDSINQLPDMGKAAIGTGLLFLIGLLSIGRCAAGWATTPGTTSTCSPTPPSPDVLAPAVHGQRVRRRADRQDGLVRAVRVGDGPGDLVPHPLADPAEPEAPDAGRGRDGDPGIVSVLISGRKLHRMGAEAGQFFRWRFLARACGSARTRTRCRRHPAPTCCASR